ncbi:MAG: hypothetical protein KDD50_15455, partial [Bdellovibrionales bacterium]|nr:hypothetical protein [Bdellovibrionales bacterium]
MKNFVLLILLFFSQISFANSTLGYDPGPDPLTSEGKGYINIVNTVPDAPFIGKKFFNGKDKFRYPFGIMPWRGPTDKNSVKVLVIGQDGTHIAEAAGRPFTGGTGGR